jgi:hypothetical protein
LISADDTTVSLAVELDLGASGHGMAESEIRDLIHKHPLCLPIAEIDPLFTGAISICTELRTPAGPIDNFLVTSDGMPVIVECKLWRNSQSRREVVGQILDYSKELTKWSASDVQREVSRRIGRKGNVVVDILRNAGHEINETFFNDALSFNLRRGRFLLLIVGDGIREGVEAIAEYLQAHAGLHFTFGLVEMPVYRTPDGGKLLVPRVMVRTQSVVRTVVSLPSGTVIAEEQRAEEELEVAPERTEILAQRREFNRSFWRDFLQELNLDDPDQLLPKPSIGGNVTFKLGSTSGSAWVTVYREINPDTVGVFLSFRRGSIGERTSQALSAQASEIKEELPFATVNFAEARPRVSESLRVGDLEDAVNRDRALSWLRDKTNSFVNALRPRTRSIEEELQFGPNGREQ